MFRAIDASTGEPFGDSLSTHSHADVEAACEAAYAAFPVFSMTSAAERAALLERIGAEIVALGDALLDVASRESGLPLPRLQGERGRTVSQLQLFANVLRDGDWLGLRIDSADPSRTPPRPDLRLLKVALGPVAVFGASNFPLAFSTAGGDTASALAAGCPVVVKAHPAHKATSLMVAGAVARAVAASGLPSGVFGHLQSPEIEIGQALVGNVRIAAVGFTGSRSGGLALVKIAQARPVPVPVYAEMSSVNPVVLLPDSLSQGAEQLAAGFVSSLTLGSGQFCTNPGLVIAAESDGLDRFITAAAGHMSKTRAQTMLTPGIHRAYVAGAERLRKTKGVSACGHGAAGPEPFSALPEMFSVTVATFLEDPSLAEEVFGPAALVIRCPTPDDIAAALSALEGQLTASLHLTDADLPLARTLMPIVSQMAGRIIVNNWPTGVEVGHAMVHGGPFPATSDGRTTSVGSLAIERFLRPLSYQNVPIELLPDPLRDPVAQGLPVRLDGTLISAH